MSDFRQHEDQTVMNIRSLATLSQNLFRAARHLTFWFCSFRAATQLAAAANVFAWGAGTIVKPSDNNDFGQSIVPANVTNAVLAVGGWRHSLALENNGSVAAWGDWGDTSLGTTNLPAASNYVALACGDLFSVALKSDGTLALAGDGYYGQTQVPPGLSNVVAIACGSYHGLALKSDGTVIAWSTNSGALGTQNYNQTSVPAGLSNVVAIAGGGWHSLALKSDGTLAAWGRNDYGQGSIPAGLSNVVAISAGVAHNLVLKSDGTLFAWGLNIYGETNIPAGLSNVVAIAAGGWHNLALKSDGTVVGWGAGSGSNTNVDYGQNTPPAKLTNVVRIGTGKVHSLAVIGAGPPPTQVLLTNFTVGTNGFSVSVPTLNGRVYRLEYKDSLTDPAWTGLPLHAGTGGLLQMSVPGIAAPQRFFRVRQW